MYSRILFERCKKILNSKSLLLLGPRQVGKSTLIRSLKPNLIINLSNQREYLEHLKDPALIERLVSREIKSSFVFIDEVQRIPSLLNTVQGLIDEDPSRRFALSGSSVRKLMRGKANLLPGRILCEKLFPLNYWELGDKIDLNFLEKILIKGSLPEVVDSELSDDILESYVDIYLREEIQAEALTKDLGDYGRFLNLAAEISGQFLNYSKLASDSEINKEKIRRYFEILNDTLLIHRIESYGEISSKRKSRQKDRFIFFDNGVRNAILKQNRNIFTKVQLGYLFEDWIFQQIISWNQYNKKNWKISTYRDDRNLEVDLIIENKKITYLVEIKYQTKYRKEFGAALSEFSALKKNAKIISLVVYLGKNEQKGFYGERVMPLNQFMQYVSEIE